jgi:hypothetical protein
MIGAVSRMEGDLDRGIDAVEGWYDRVGETGLEDLLGKSCGLNLTRRVARGLSKGDSSSFFSSFPFLHSCALDDHCDSVSSEDCAYTGGARLLTLSLTSISSTSSSLSTALRLTRNGVGIWTVGNGSTYGRRPSGLSILVNNRMDDPFC